MMLPAVARPEQLALDLAHRAALGAEDFLVGSSNSAAVDLVDRWPDWSAWAAVVSGPDGSGKSHLVNVWRVRSNAVVADATALDETIVGRFAETGALAVEDLDRGVANEAVLFHLLNLARENGRTILLTSRLAPGELQIALPDLRSRLRALPHVMIAAPDATLLSGLLVKLFTDRQLKVEPNVIAFIQARMERSMAAAIRLVAEIDRRSLAGRRRVTRVLAAEVLSCENPGDD